MAAARHDQEPVVERDRLAQGPARGRQPVDRGVDPAVAQPRSWSSGRERALKAISTCGAARASRSRSRTAIIGPSGCGIDTTNCRSDVAGSKPR
ncbi:MAG TPA: hypothetical protein VLA98_07055, partial [Solirubrobacteraceae bacterium]|nr:hypothetical protein [Solirubrobacteraceae bacterium]